jgi:hypothetical protein
MVACGKVCYFTARSGPLALMAVAGRWLKTLGEPTFLSKIKELPV